MGEKSDKVVKGIISFTRELRGKLNERNDQEILNARFDEMRIGVENAIIMLLDLEFEYVQIIEYIRKNWGIDEGLIRDFYYDTIRIELPLRRLTLYLEEQGMSQYEIQNFIESNMVVAKLNSNKEASELSPQELVSNIDRL